MRVFIFALFLTHLLCPCLCYYQPGAPPQCFDESQCLFQARPSATGLNASYAWDLRPLCKSAGAEFIANKDPACISTGQPSGWTCPPRCGNCDPTNANIRFNICGTVSGAIAPVNEDDPSCTGQGGVNCPQELPIPHSHGIGIQVRRIAPFFFSRCCAGLSLSLLTSNTSLMRTWITFAPPPPYLTVY
jgi:hypothetical protein